MNARSGSKQETESRALDSGADSEQSLSTTSQVFTTPTSLLDQDLSDIEQGSLIPAQQPELVSGPANAVIVTIVASPEDESMVRGMVNNSDDLSRSAMDEIQDTSLPQNSDDEESDDDEDSQYHACCLRIKPLRPVLSLLPLSVALSEAADTGRSLWTSHTTSYPIIISASGAAFLASFGLTGETTRENFNETCEVIKKRRLPRDWPRLSTNQERAAFSISFIPASWSPISEGMQAYFFISGIPVEYKFDTAINPTLWVFGSILIACGAGASSALTESMEMYKVVRERIAGVRKQYKNKVSAVFSPVFGGVLGTLDALQKSTQGYIAIKSIFSITSTHGRILIGIPSMINTIPTFCFSGLFNINSLDEFFGYIQECRVEPTKIIAFSLSLALGVYLAFWKRALNISFYQDVVTDFGYNSAAVPNTAYEIISWAVFVQESVLATESLYAPMHNLVKRVSSGIGRVYRGICWAFSCCTSHSDSDSDDNDVEREPLLNDYDENQEIVISFDTAAYGEPTLPVDPHARSQPQADRTYDEESLLPDENRLPRVSTFHGSLFADNNAPATTDSLVSADLLRRNSSHTPI